MHSHLVTMLLPRDPHIVSPRDYGACGTCISDTCTPSTTQVHPPAAYMPLRGLDLIES